MISEGSTSANQAIWIELAAEVTEIGVQRLRARDRQEDETENGEPDKTVAYEEADAIPGIDGDEHVGIRNHVDEAANQ